VSRDLFRRDRAVKSLWAALILCALAVSAGSFLIILAVISLSPSSNAAASLPVIEKKPLAGIF
jgi:hypothetical protein